MNKKMKRLLLAGLLSLGMVATNSTTINAKQVQSVVEGSMQTEDSKVGTLSDVVSANLLDYYENGSFRVTKVQENVFHIDEATTDHPADGPTNNASSMYLVVDETSATLIDGGNGQYNSNFSKENMTAILNDLVGTKDFKIILTHLHGDHIGLLVNNTDVIDPKTPVLIHEDDFENLRASVKENYVVSKFKGGDTINASGLSLKVVDIPGHTDGSNALIDYSKEIIFTGDAIGSGSVWMPGLPTDLVDFDKGINNLMEAIKDMDNPIIYCGHRWQQFNGGAHATETVTVGEIGKKYVEEMDALMDDILKGDYNVNDHFTPAPYDVGIYSKTEKYPDGIFPGIVVDQRAINVFTDKTAPVINGKDITIKVGTEGTIEELIDLVVTDNVDDNPIITVNVEPEFDASVVGIYKVIVKAVDISGNEATQEFTINVVVSNFDNNETPVINPSDNQKPIVKEDPVIDEDEQTLTDDKKENTSSRVKTGDTMNIVPYTLGTILCGGLLISLRLKREKSE